MANGKSAVDEAFKALDENRDEGKVSSPYLEDIETHLQVAAELWRRAPEAKKARFLNEVKRLRALRDSIRKRERPPEEDAGA